MLENVVSLAWERREDCSVTYPGFLFPGQPNAWGCLTELWNIQQDLFFSEVMLLCILARHQILIQFSTHSSPALPIGFFCQGKGEFKDPYFLYVLDMSRYWEAEWSCHHPAGPDAKGHKASLNVGLQTSLFSIFLKPVIVLHVGSPLSHNMLVKLLTNIVILFAELLQLLMVALVWATCQETASLGILPFVQSPAFHVVMHGLWI